MSFDVFLHTCNLGTRQKQIKNPFTSAAMMAYDDPGLTEPAALNFRLLDLA